MNAKTTDYFLRDLLKLNAIFVNKDKREHDAIMLQGFALQAIEGLAEEVIKAGSAVCDTPGVTGALWVAVARHLHEQILEWRAS